MSLRILIDVLRVKVPKYVVTMVKIKKEVVQRNRLSSILMPILRLEKKDCGLKSRAIPQC